MAATAEDLPRYNDLMLPTLRAVDSLGGSGNAREITRAVIDVIKPTDEQLSLTYPDKPKLILLDRLNWARSYCKLAGVLDSPKRGIFLVTRLGREIVALDDDEAEARLRDLDREVRRRRPKATKDEPSPSEDEEVDEQSSDLDASILARLHKLSPLAFEEFCMYLLRAYGMELMRVGGSGDEGIDGIGTAPISPVLSVTVAVQAKRWDPTKKAVGREVVALFQRDAAAAGAERAVLITLGSFSEPARKASRQATPTVDLIDGERLCELIREQRMGLVESVDDQWFDRFEPAG